MLKMKILLADSDAVQRQDLKTLLAERGYEVVEAADDVEVWQNFEIGDAPHVALLDISRPGIGGAQICRRARQREDLPFIYVILLGNAGQRKEIKEGIRGGADDFLIKPVDPLELEVRIRGGQRAIQWRERLSDSERIIRHQANHDPLTGTWNRVAIIDALRRELTRVHRQQGAVAILMIGLDGLRKLNRSHNYAVGDEALRAVAQRLSATLRPYDSVGRYGGEVFLVIVPGCREADALKQAARLQASLSREAAEAACGGMRPLARDNSTWITLSIGVAAAEGEGEAAPLLHAAEEALKKARKAGGNHVESSAVRHSAGPPRNTAMDVKTTG